jgi:MFS transporter, sugar porter (SP) family
MNSRLYFVTFVAALGGFLFGFDTAVISGTDLFVVPHFHLNDEQWGWTVSSALAGTILGAAIAGIPANKLGRKNSLFITAVLYFVCAIGCALAPDWNILLTARFIGGVGVGLASVLSPMYIAEVSPAAVRGRLVAIAQLNIVVGILVAYFSNKFLVGFPDNWRLMFGAQAVPSVLFFALLFMVPESPRWLVSRGRNEEALSVLKSINNDPTQTENVLEEIKASLQEKAGKFKSLFEKKYRYLTLLAFLFATFNQLSGINVFIYYAPRILQKTGLSAEEALWQTFIAVGVTNLIFTILAMIMIDRFGRKTLMIFGSVGLMLSLGLMSYAFFTQSFGKEATLLYLVGFIGSFAFSQGAVMWVFLSEIFPNQLRDHGASLGSFTHWFWNFVIANRFPVAIAAFGGGPVFAFFALSMVAQLLFVLFMMPETRGKTLEELEKELVKAPA